MDLMIHREKNYNLLSQIDKVKIDMIISHIALSNLSGTGQEDYNFPGFSRRYSCIEVLLKKYLLKN